MTDPANPCAIADRCEMSKECPFWHNCRMTITDEAVRLDRIEKRLEEIVQFLDGLGPLVAAARQFMASPSFKLMGKLQRDKTGKDPK